MIISSGSSTGSQKPRKLSIPARIATKFHTGRLAGARSQANFDQPDLSEGRRSLYKLSTRGQTGTGGTRVAGYDSKVRVLKLEPGTVLIVLVVCMWDKLGDREIKISIVVIMPHLTTNLQHLRVV